MWEGPEHVVARPGSGTPQRTDAYISDGRLADIEFVGPDGEPMPPKLNRSGHPDVLSLQGVREITSKTGTLFDQVLGLKGERG